MHVKHRQRKQKTTALMTSPLSGSSLIFVPFLASAMAAPPVLHAMIKETSALIPKQAPAYILILYYTENFSYAPDRFRTCDIQVNSLTLYRLSYRSKRCDHRESNPGSNLGRVVSYHWTMDAGPTEIRTQVPGSHGGFENSESCVLTAIR